jgi:uncharacterized protein involved in exopolysaccharide biosynthesis
VLILVAGLFLGIVIAALRNSGRGSDEVHV